MHRFFTSLRSLRMTFECSSTVGGITIRSGSGRSRSPPLRLLERQLTGEVEFLAALRPDEGEVVFDGKADLTKLDEADIATLGIGRKFQKPTVFENHTVFENLELAMKTDKRVRHSLLARLSSGQRDLIARTLQTIRLAGSEDRLAGSLSHGQKQWLEIGMLLMQEPELILLDEPVAGMTDGETARTAELILELAGTHSVVVVEHDMDFVGKIARTVTVLHEGSVLAEGSMAAVQADERVIEVYLGR